MQMHLHTNKNTLLKVIFTISNALKVPLKHHINNLSCNQ